MRPSLQQAAKIAAVLSVIISIYSASLNRQLCLCIICRNSPSQVRVVASEIIFITCLSSDAHIPKTLLRIKSPSKTAASLPHRLLTVSKPRRGLSIIYNIIVQQRRVMNHLDYRRNMDMLIRDFAARPAR